VTFLYPSFAFRKDKNMWLDNIKELKKSKGMSVKQIAEATNLPERTVTRIFSGDTPNPYVDTLYRIVVILDGSLDDVLADSKTVVGNKSLATLQEDVDKLNGEVDRLNSELAIANAENAVLKDKNIALSTENDLLRMKLEHKEELLSLHNYYNSIKRG
jgi:transcriptional regulator with XRE-family HTH domain